MDKILLYIGISYKSRHLITGTDAVIDSLKKNKIHLIFLCQDASLNLKDKIMKKAFYYNIKVIDIYDSNELSQILPKRYMVIGIDDLGISNAIMKLI